MSAKKELRRQTEARMAATEFPDMSALDPETLIQELRTHQIELEIQNEALRLTEIELTEARDLFSDLYDFAPVGYVTINDKGLIQHANQTMTDLLAMDRDSLIEQPFSAFVATEDQGACYLYRNAVIASRQRQVIELRMQKADCDLLWVQLVMTVAKQADSKQANTGSEGLLIVISDITERKQSQKDIREAEENYRLIMDQNTEGIVIVDMEGCVLYLNPAASGLFGKQKKIILGQPFGQPMKADAQIEIVRDGTDIRRVDMRSAPGRWQGSDVRIVWLHDRTEHVQSIEALEESHAMLNAALEGTIFTISKAVEARDPYTAGHQQRVARLASAIATEMGMDEDYIQGIDMGATIHDIGKITLPAEILSKPSKLSDMEYMLIQSHCQIGYDILKDVAFPWPVADIAYQHHERINGTGYPQGLKGDAICLEAKVIAVADVVEAMCSHRPYRAALGIDAALLEITAHRGEWFDPAAVDACLKLFAEDRFSFDVRR